MVIWCQNTLQSQTDSEGKLWLLSRSAIMWIVCRTVTGHSILLNSTRGRFQLISCVVWLREREREMFYLTTHSTHFINGYMASDIWLRTILVVRKETRCCHIGYSYRLTARVLLYAPSHRQDNTYHGLCYTSRGALAGTRNSSMGPPHEGSIRRPIAPWANALPLSYIPLCLTQFNDNRNVLNISLNSIFFLTFFLSRM